MSRLYVAAQSAQGRTPKLFLATAAFSLATLASSANAAILFSDNFTVTGPNTQNVNQETPGIRQTGPLASSTAYDLGPDHHQVNNTETDVGQPGGVTDGNHVLVAFNGWFQSSFEIGAALANGAPLTISFDMYQRHNPDRGAPDNWGAFTLRAPGQTFPVAGGGEFGWLFRNNGAVQMFQTTADNGTYDVAGLFTSSHWNMTFSDTAGTGSAFVGAGSVLRMQNGAGPVFTVPLGQLNATGLRLGFRNLDAAFVGIDNLVIQGVPEPSAVFLLIGGISLAALRRRSCRG